MKILTALSAILAASIAAVPVSRAQSGGMKGMDMKGMDMKAMPSENKAQAQVHKGSGTVTKVDSAGGKVTIAHGPISSMKWSAMSMTFAVKDKALLGKLSTDRKVEFEFVQQGSDFVITSAR